MVVYRHSTRWSPDSEHVLVSAGWRSGRAIEIEIYTRVITRWGLPVTESAVAFLREHGGLAIPRVGRGGAEEIVVDPRALFEPVRFYEDLDRVRVLGDSIDEVVTPIGWVTRAPRHVAVVDRELELFAGLSGSVYAYAPHDALPIRLAGSDGDRALEALVRGHELRVVAEMQWPDDGWDGVE